MTRSLRSRCLAWSAHHDALEPEENPWHTAHSEMSSRVVCSRCSARLRDMQMLDMELYDMETRLAELEELATKIAVGTRETKRRRGKHGYSDS